jgi:hypothetical protein
MKKLLYILASLAVVFTAACSKEEQFSQEGKGAVTFSFPVTRADVDEAVYQMLKFRIYSYNASGEKSLVRLYTWDEIKDMKMWLVAGSYSIEVEGGVKTVASFTDIYYFGGEDFTLSAGEEKEVKVNVYPKNTLIKVVFDASIAANMENAQAVVAIAEEFDFDKITSQEVPSLVYKDTAVGYFMIEQGEASFVWNFSGSVPSKNTAVDKFGKYTPAEGFKPGYQYTITFKYSPDLPGYISLSVNVDTTEDIKNSDLVFKPEPQIEGASTILAYEGMEAVIYNVKAINELTTMKLMVDGNEYIYSTESGATNSNEGYFTVEQVNEGSNMNWKVTLADNFIEGLKAHKQTLIFTAVDVEGVEGEVEVDCIGEGAFAMTINDAWAATATLKAYVNNSTAADVKIYYREAAPAATEWVEAPATLLSDNIYTASITGISGQRTYEYYLSYGNEQRGASATFRTGGASIPRGGLEVWSGSLPMCPSEYTGKNQSLTWDTGNHGSEMASTNVTVKSTDVHAGSTGQYSAYLKSVKASVMGIGKFAAGNIFYGRFVALDGTNGILQFGQPFTFDYKPKKLVVWYKGNVGTVNYAGGGLSEGGSDKAHIFVWLYDNKHSALAGTAGRYQVNTKYNSTFTSADGKYSNAGDGNSTSHKAGDRVEGLIAYGYWNRTQSTTTYNGERVSVNYNGWTKLEIPLVYLSDKKPSALVISCASSALGDYFAGSTSSDMYVDDFEFAY